MVQSLTDDISVAVWLKHSEREPKRRLSLVQSPGSNTSTQPRPHLPVWQGLGVCRHPGRAPCGSPDQQAGQPGVPGGGGWSRQPGQFREVALCFSEACPKKLCESPTSHSYGRGDEARGSEALTQPSNCTWLCLLPVPSSLPHSWGKQHQEEKREETGGGVSHPSPISCKAAPVPHRPCHLLLS